MDEELKQVAAWIDTVEALVETYPDKELGGDLWALQTQELRRAVYRMRRNANIEIPTLASASSDAMPF